MTSGAADSRTGRLLAGAGGGLGVAWRSSVSGRAAGRVRLFLLRLVAGSVLLSLRAAGSRPLSGAASPGTASRALQAVAYPYVWTRRVVGAGRAGVFARKAGGSVAEATLSGGGGIRLVGALVVGVGVGSMVHVADGGSSLGGLLAAAAVVVVGSVVLGAGPAVGRSVAQSLTARVTRAIVGFSPSRVVGPAPRGAGEAAGRRRGWPFVFGLAVGLALLAGVLAGLASGGTAIVVAAAGAVACGAAVGLYRPELALLAFAAFPWVDFVLRRAGGGRGSLLDGLLLVAAGAALLFTVIVTRRWDLRTVPLTVPFLAALVCAVASVTVNHVPQSVGLFALRLTFQSLLFYLLGYLLPKDGAWVRLTVAVFLSSAVLLALHGLLQVATHAPMPVKWVDVHETIGTRAYSIVENPNGLGAFLALAALLGLSLALARLPRGQRLAAGVATIVLLAGLAATFSRGAWIGFGVGLLALAALSRVRLFLGIIVVGAVAPLVLPGALIDRLTFAFSQAYLAKSASAGRLFIWNVALAKIAEHPFFGVGLGTFGGTSAFLYAAGTLWVDNFYLQLAAEGGLLLLAAFLWLLLRAAKGLVLARRRQVSPYGRAVAAGVFAGFVAVAVANVTASVWETLVVASAFWFMTGFAADLPGDLDQGRLIPVSALGEEPPA